MADVAAPPPDAAPAGHPPAGPRAARVRARWPARVAVAGGSLVFMLALAFLGLFVFLSRGPVSAPFLKDRVTVALEQRLGEHVDVDVREAKLEKTPRGIEVHVYDVIFRDMSGKELLRSPEALVGFDPLQLLALRVAPRRLALQGMVLKAEIRADGDVRLLTGGPSAVSTETGRLQDVLGALAAVARSGTISGLSEISIREAALVIEDQRVGKEVKFDKLNATFRQTPDGVSAIDGSVHRGDAGIPFRLAAQAAGDGARLDLRISDMPLRMAETVGGFERLAFSENGKLALDASLSLDGKGQPSGGTAKLSLASGPFSLPGVFNKPLQVEKAEAALDWRGGAERIENLRLTYADSGTRIVFAGPVLLPGEGRSKAIFDATAEELALSPLRPGEKPVVVTEGRMRVRLGGPLEGLAIEQLTLRGPETQIDGQGEIMRADGGMQASARLNAAGMPLGALLRYWPSGIASEGRSYLIDNGAEGRVPTFNLTLNLPPPSLAAMLRQEALPQEAFGLDFTVEDGRLRPVAGLPLITGITGVGRVDSLQGTMNARSGQIDLREPGQRRIALSEGSVQVKRLDTWTPDLVVQFRAQTAAEHALELISLPPLREAAPKGVSPQDVRGQFDGRVRIAVPLGRSLKPGDVRAEANGTLRNLTIEKAIGRDKLEGANLQLAFDHTGVAVNGEGRWQGLPVQVSLEQDSADKSTATVLSFTVDEAMQRRYGLAGQVSGPLPVRIKGQRDDGAALKAQLEIDLTRAAIDGLLPGFQKPAGRPGRLTFDAVERQRGYTLQNIALDSGVASIRGQADVSSDGRLTAARLNLFRLSPGDNVRLDFDRSGSTGRIQIRGNNLDARPFLRNATQPPGTRPERDVDLDLKTTLLTGNGGEVLTNAEVRVQRRSGQVRQIAVTGRLNGKPVSLTGQASDRPAPITIESEDAGATLRFFDVYARMSGGALSAQLRQTARDMTGYVIARNFSLRDEPALRRLLAENRAEGRAVTPENAQFTKMRIDFTRTGSSTQIREAVIFGPQIGLSFSGMVDFVRDRISLSGTYVPAYGLNNAFAQIPVIGAILGGGRNEGLLAITFGVSGRASQPEVSINPLSAVAPGILRRIFEFRNDGVGATGPARRP